MNTAALQVNRIVSMVSDLSRRHREGHPDVKVAELAQRLGVSERQISKDLSVLTMMSDDPECDWLSSLRVWQEGDTLALSTCGPFQRPVRLLPDELLSIRVGLAVESDTVTDLVAELWPDAADAEEPLRAFSVGAHVSGCADVLDLTRSAIEDRCCLELLYAGEGSSHGRARTIQPHQLVFHGGVVYINAYCESVKSWRRFRADRVVDASLSDRHFEWRDDFEPIDDSANVFIEPDDVDGGAEVPADQKAPLMVERHGAYMMGGDGSQTNDRCGGLLVAVDAAAVAVCGEELRC